MGERMCRSSHLLLRPFLQPSLSRSREGMKRIVKRTKEFNGIRGACRGQGSMPEIRSTAIVPRFRGNKTISASVFPPPSPFQLIEQPRKESRNVIWNARKESWIFVSFHLLIISRFSKFPLLLSSLCVTVFRINLISLVYGISDDAKGSKSRISPFSFPSKYHLSINR